MHWMSSIEKSLKVRETIVTRLTPGKVLRKDLQGPYKKVFLALSIITDLNTCTCTRG